MHNALKRFNITIINPAGNQHAGVFNEIAETLLQGLRNIPVIATLTENTLIPENTNIVIGANLLEEGDIDLMSEDTIIYNLEQITETSPWMTPTLMQLMKKCEVWDYSLQNIATLKALGITNRIHHLPIGYVEGLTRIERMPTQDIDVLFYGSLNDRRERIIHQLKQAGLNVITLFGVYGDERDRYIARAKVVLNMHFYDSKIFELVRASYLFANKKAVVSECSDINRIDEDLRGAALFTPYDGLVEACLSLLHSEDKRHALEQQALALFSRRDESQYLVQLIYATNDVNPRSDPTLPSSLNIGSGKDYRAGYLNIDFSPHWNPDIIADLSDPNLIGMPLEHIKRGAVTLSREYFDEIIANDVLEHIPNLTDAMTNCLNLLKPGGEFKINVPYDLSYGAWQDPTHVRAFNERSWLYYTDWFWYLGWAEARFDVTTLQYILSPLGERLQDEGKTREEILTQPRAVDSMYVVLRKRRLTDEEQRLVTKTSTHAHLKA